MSSLTPQQAFEQAIRDRHAGRLEAAIASCTIAAQQRPDVPEVHLLLGSLLLDKGQPDHAARAFNQAIALRPDSPEAHYNWGIALFGIGENDQAIAAFGQATRLRPNYGLAHNNRGLALQRAGRLEEAAAACRQAILVLPTFADAYYNLAGILHDAGQLPEAIAQCRLAIAQQPNHAKALDLLGTLLRLTGQHAQALTAYQQALQYMPTAPGIRWNLGILRLLLGDYQQGWQDYEARLKVPDFPVRIYAQPMWTGVPLAGRKILLHTEQGMGDAIQFIRYAPLVAAHGGRVIVQCPAPLRRLFAGQKGIDQVIGDKETPPPFDVQCPLLSLPRIFQMTVENIPPCPYLRAETDLVQTWKDRLSTLPAGFKVGLVWAGSPNSRNARARSANLHTFAPLAAIPGVQFISLQKGEAAAQAKSPPAGMQIIDWPDAQENFAQTAAMMSNLDLIVGVDTAVTHLACALGKPAWVLIPYAPDWRWMVDRTDSPWYPTIRLFRQSVAGDWTTPVEEMARQLAKLVAAA